MTVDELIRAVSAALGGCPPARRPRRPRRGRDRDRDPASRPPTPRCRRRQTPRRPTAHPDAAVHGVRVLRPARLGAAHRARHLRRARRPAGRARRELHRSAGRLLRPLLRPGRQRAAAALRARRRAVRRLADRSHDLERRTSADGPAGRDRSSSCPTTITTARPTRSLTFMDGLPATVGLLFTGRLSLLPGRHAKILRVPYAPGDRTPSGESEEVANLTGHRLVSALAEGDRHRRRRHDLRDQRRRRGRSRARLPPTPFHGAHPQAGATDAQAVRWSRRASATRSRCAACAATTCASRSS